MCQSPPMPHIALNNLGRGDNCIDSNANSTFYSCAVHSLYSCIKWPWKKLCLIKFISLPASCYVTKMPFINIINLLTFLSEVFSSKKKSHQGKKKALVNIR